MPPLPPTPCLLAATAAVRHRVSSRLLDGCDEWWQVPALVAGLAALALFAIWTYRRDGAQLGPWMRGLLATLRLAVLATVALAWLDLERIAEHEIVRPSRVAVLVDSSASMAVADDGAAGTRSRRAVDALEAGGLLAALSSRHEVSLWRFDADAEPLATLPPAAAAPPAAASADDWRGRLAPAGYETRLGEALTRVVDREPAGTLAAVVLLSDGGNNAGIDPLAAAAGLARVTVAVHPLGIGADVLPPSIRIADLAAPARVFPGDRLALTAFLQAQGLAGTNVRLELLDQEGATPSGPGRLLDTVEARIGADGDLVPVRFDVPGLAAPGRHTLTVRVAPPAGLVADGDDTQAVDVEVVDRTTQVLLMAGGPGREYQFLRNVLERDASFAVDVLLGTAAPGISQDARRILDAFPGTDEALAEYDVVVAIDYDWRRLDPAAQARLERWVATESGGLVLVAGGICMEPWLADPRPSPLRGLFPVDLRRGDIAGSGSAPGRPEPQPLEFTRDGIESEFLWLAPGRDASQAAWREFPGVYACHASEGPKPGATVYAWVADPGGGGRRVWLAGQFYGSGTVLYAGSGELWRLRSLADGAHERLVAQVVRHAAQARLLRGSRTARLLVDRDRYPVGAAIVVRLVPGATAPAAALPACRALAPDGRRLDVPLTADPVRPDAFAGTFVAGDEGAWQIEVDAGPLVGAAPLSRRVQVQLPDRELARPRLDRTLLSLLAAATGGTPRFLVDGDWSAERARELAAEIPDRSRTEYETGAPDRDFKRRLNTLLLAAGCGLVCTEWVLRRVVRLA